MRLFVALVPPAAVVDELRAALAGVPGAAFPPTVRWAGPERWHLTLAFLGPVDEATRAALADRLAPRAEGTGPFRLSLAGTGHFDHRVWWAGVCGDTAALHRLAGSVREAARCVGLPVEDRPYRPHLTLARTAGGRRSGRRRRRARRVPRLPVDRPRAGPDAQPAGRPRRPLPGLRDAVHLAAARRRPVAQRPTGLLQVLPGRRALSGR